MANTIRIKRRNSGAAGAPATLENAELAFNEVDDVLYYGEGTGGAGGSASAILAIGGSGAFATLATAQTISGAKTFTGDVIVPTQDAADSSTKVATTAFVKAQSYLTANQSITVSGDASGSGTTSITLSLASSGVTPGTYTKVTVDAKGRATVGANLAAEDIPSLTAAKISDFATEVVKARLDQMAAPTASVSLNSQKITGLATPTADTDAATKGYVDAVKTGLDVKESVRAATTEAITLSGEQTIDGVSVLAGDRVLVKNQADATKNGIYVVASGSWSRAADFDGAGEVTPGAFTFCEQGTNNADSGWVLTTDGTIEVGTSELAFTQFSGAGQVEAGSGLGKVGNVINIGTASSGRIVVNSDSIDLATTGVGAGSYSTVTVDAYGRVTAGSNPTTLSGYGISDAQPLDATLTALAGLSTAADAFIYATAADTFTTGTITSFGRSLVDDSDAGTARTTLGLGSIATQAASNVAITGGSINGVTFDGGEF